MNITDASICVADPGPGALSFRRFAENADWTQGRNLHDCGRMGAVAAAEGISHLGARPEAGLKALASERVPA